MCGRLGRVTVSNIISVYSGSILSARGVPTANSVNSRTDRASFSRTHSTRSGESIILPPLVPKLRRAITQLHHRNLTILGRPLPPSKVPRQPASKTLQLIYNEGSDVWLDIWFRKTLARCGATKCKCVFVALMLPGATC